MRQFRAPTAVWENGVGQGQFGQSNFAAPKKRCRIRPERRFHSGITTKLDHVIDSGVHPEAHRRSIFRFRECLARGNWTFVAVFCALRSEEHTSELQSLRHLVCRLLLEKKKGNKTLNPVCLILKGSMLSATVLAVG